MSNFESQILSSIVRLGGRILSETEFYFHGGEYEGLYYYEECHEAGDWVAYPAFGDSKDVDTELLIITPQMIPELESVLKSYFEV